MAALDLVECHIGFRRINALMRFVNDEKLPLHIDKLFQFVVLTAEIERTFQILQADKLDTISDFIHQTCRIFVTGHDERLTF